MVIQNVFWPTKRTIHGLFILHDLTVPVSSSNYFAMTVSVNTTIRFTITSVHWDVSGIFYPVCTGKLTRGNYGNSFGTRKEIVVIKSKLNMADSYRYLENILVQRHIFYMKLISVTINISETKKGTYKKKLNHYVLKFGYNIWPKCNWPICIYM